MRVLIVDDEERIGKLLKYLIDWEKEGFQIIRIMQSGKAALEVIESEKPDILITDIRMPEVNGLSLLEKVHQCSPKTRCIVISGYRKFEYARKAMQYGVISYLLKPIKKEELLTVLNEIRKERRESAMRSEYVSYLESSQRQLIEKKRQMFFTDFLEGNWNAEKYTLEFFNQDLNFEFYRDTFLIFCIRVDFVAGGKTQIDLKTINSKYVHSVISRSLENRICKLVEIPLDHFYSAILNFKKEDFQMISHKFYHLIYDLKNTVENGKICVTLGHGGVVYSPTEFPRALEDAKAALYQRIYMGTDRIINYHMKSNCHALAEKLYTASFREDILVAIKEGNSKRVKSLYKELRETIQKQEIGDGATLIVIALYWGRFFFGDSVKMKLKAEVIKLELSYREELAECMSQRMVFECMENIAQYVMDLLDRSRQTKDLKPIYMAKTYIEENYARPVTLEEISSYAGLSHAYLSALFKKETGRNFTEYLSMVRIERAKRLLKDSNQTLMEVANRVGYIDDKYFSRVFKKYTSLTPGEYRQLYYSVKEK